MRESRSLPTLWALKGKPLRALFRALIHRLRCVANEQPNGAAASDFQFLTLCPTAGPVEHFVRQQLPSCEFLTLEPLPYATNKPVGPFAIFLHFGMIGPKRGRT